MNEHDMPKRLGRPPGQNRPAAERPTRNITLDRETCSSLESVQQGMSEELGFNLTLSQTVKRLIKIAVDSKGRP